MSVSVYAAMKKITVYTWFFLLLMLIHSCIVSGPKYTRVEKVMTLEPGMTRDDVNARLGLKPYDIYCFDSTGNRSYVYKYRTTDRKTVPFLLKDTNGVKSRGKYMDLIAYYDTSNVAYRFESKPTDSKLDEKRLDINTVVTIITVTLPTLLVYFGITKNE